MFYLRYVALNFGLGGIMMNYLPGFYIPGYTDEPLLKMEQTPVYMGGDATVDPFVSINAP